MGMNERQINTIQLLIAAAAANDSRSLSAKEYLTYRQRINPAAPTLPTIIRHFGSWSGALKAAGLQPPPIRRTRCARCGKRFEQLVVDQRYCSKCVQR